MYLGTGDAFLISLDAETGRPDPEFGREGRVDLTQGLSRAVTRPINDPSSGIPRFVVGSPPILCAGVLVVGSNIADGAFQLDGPPGDVRACDPVTGEQLWRFGPASAQPMTHLYRGKQYLVVTVGGMGVWKEELVAFALP